MNIMQSTAEKLYITDIKGLDPITVFLEDFGPSQGRITIGKSVILRGRIRCLRVLAENV